MEIKLNQEVIIVGIGNCARYSTPIHKGTVSKIGRKWFEVNTASYLGEREKFSLKDGKGYMSEYRVFESEDIYDEYLNKPKLANLIVDSIKSLSYKELRQVSVFIESLNLK